MPPSHRFPTGEAHVWPNPLGHHVAAPLSRRFPSGCHAELVEASLTRHSAPQPASHARPDQLLPSRRTETGRPSPVVLPLHFRSEGRASARPLIRLGPSATDLLPLRPDRGRDALPRVRCRPRRPTRRADRFPHALSAFTDTTRLRRACPPLVGGRPPRRALPRIPFEVACQAESDGAVAQAETRACRAQLANATT